MPDDSEFQRAVHAELDRETGVNPAHVCVAAEAGAVTLTGHVEYYAQKRAAGAAMGRVNGVRAVADEPEVRLPYGVKRGAGDIAAVAADRLAWDVSVPRAAVHVRVEHGWVTLTGEARRWFQGQAAEHGQVRLTGTVRSQRDRQLAAETAWAAQGATDVQNLITAA